MVGEGEGGGTEGEGRWKGMEREGEEERVGEGRKGRKGRKGDEKGRGRKCLPSFRPSLRLCIHL